MDCRRECRLHHRHSLDEAESLLYHHQCRGQEKDPSSVLSYYKKLIAFRKADEHQDPLIYGKTVPFHPELSKLFGYQRIGEKETLTVLCSFSTEEIRVPLDTLTPKVVLNNKETFTMNGTDLVMAPYQAVVLASAAE